LAKTSELRFTENERSNQHCGLERYWPWYGCTTCLHNFSCIPHTSSAGKLARW